MHHYPWFDQYPKGIPHHINSDEHPSLLTLINDSLEKYGSLQGFTGMGKALTFNEVKEQSDAFAAYLQGLGLKKGDKIGIQMPNVLQYTVVLIGALKAGLIIVNVNPLYTAREMIHQYNDAEIETVVILSNFADKLEEILPKTHLKNIIITRIGDFLGGFKGCIVNLVVKYIKKMEPKYHIPQAILLNKAIKEGKNKVYHQPEISGSDIAFLQYTGGTTGVSKGAILTHKNIISNVLQIKEWMINMEEGKEVMITALPLYHIFALTVNFFLMLHIGAKNVMIINPRDMKAFLKEWKKHQFTVFTGVNTLFNGLLNQKDFLSVDFSKAKYVIGGGMAVQKSVAEEWKEKTGTAIAEGYGLSETSPVLTCNPLDGKEQIGSIGIPIPSTVMTVLDDNENVLPIGEIGELCAKGPQVMQAYWNRPDETQKVFTQEGWFKTGDMGYMQEDGFFRIVDRKKDMILVSGFNVYPNEVEEVVVSHPDVLEAAAIGVPDEESGERVKIFVVRKNNSLTKEELLSFCKKGLTNYKIPKYIEFREELPKSNVGKILRKELKK